VEIIQNQVLKLNLPALQANEITSRIDRSEASGTDTLLYWEYTEAAQAAYILDPYQPDPALPQIPSTIMRDYSFPTVFPTVFEHQKTTASFLSLRQRAFCFSEMGCGKSASALWASDYLMQLGLIKRVLIICPLSIMSSAWLNDIFKTVMHRTAAVAYGDKAYRGKIIKNTAYEYVIINYDGVEVCEHEIEFARFDLIIVDEANAYKNASTKRWKVLSRLINPSTRLWMMTGTPAAQSPVGAYGLAKLVSPERVPKFMTAWRDKVMWQVTRFKWVPQQDARDKVYTALQPAIRFTKKECLDLPDLIYETRDVPLTPQVAKYYKKLKNQMLIEAAGEEISAVNAAVSMTKLLQISGGAVYSDDKEIVEFDVSPRLNVLEEIIEETENKVVIFVPFIHTIDVVNKFLIDKGYTCDIIKGDVSAKNRAVIVNTFQNNPDPRILIIQPQSASHGVTLTAADTIVFWGPVTSTETFLQCCGRIDRIGQQNKMTVVMLSGSDVERKVYAHLQGKISDHLSLVELYKQVLSEV
jgi:SNF2 family DNA or RNA helicase